jgi:hypothetical protein
MTRQPKSREDVGKLFANGSRVLKMISFEARPTFTLKNLETGETETWAVGSIQDECFHRLVPEGRDAAVIP